MTSKVRALLTAASAYALGIVVGRPETSLVWQGGAGIAFLISLWALLQQSSERKPDAGERRTEGHFQDDPE